MSIKQVVPGNKNAIKYINDDGTITYHCRTHQNPVAYGPANNLQWIDLTSEAKTLSAAGKDMWLRDKNVMTVGIRKDGIKNKYLGIRPDDCQDGSEQFEISLVDIELDGAKKEITLSKDKKIALDSVTSDLGDIVIQTTRQRARQMVRVSQSITSFKITFKIHLTGLKYVKMEKLDEEWFYSEKTGKFRLRLGKPCFVDKDTFDLINKVKNFITHTVIDNGDGTLTYVKESTKEFDASKLPSEYFIDLDPIYSNTTDGWVFNERTKSSMSSTWANIVNHTTGTSVNTAETRNTSSFSSGAYTEWLTAYYGITRSFFYFNTSSITNDYRVMAASLYIYGYSTAESSVCAMKGTQADTLTVDDYNNFSGSEYGYTAWSSSGWNTITFNATGISDIVIGGTTKICGRERQYDYNVSEPGSDITNGCYFSDNTDTTYDPYLNITVFPIFPQYNINYYLQWRGHSRDLPTGLINSGVTVMSQYNRGNYLQWYGRSRDLPTKLIIEDR